MAEQNRTPHTRTASYLAEPGEVHRVLLLYSGGLDTSVMLKWIQDEYDAEVVALTVNLGQPGEDYDVVAGQGAAARRARRPRRRRARGVRPRLRRCRRSRPTPIYGLGYPLFTALGRPLIAKLAVEYAREHGCDTIAHGCTGKGNDQVRIEATVATLAPELKVIAPVRGWQMGREEEIAYAREHGIPVKGGTEARAVLDRRQPLGALVGGPLDRGPRPRARRRRLPARHAARGGARRGRGRRRSASSAGVPVALNGERLGLVELLERAAEIGCRHGVGIVDHIEDRIVGLKVRDIYEVPGGGDHPARPTRELERLVGTIHQNQFKPRARPQVGLPRLRRAVVGAAARRPRRLHGARSTRRSRGRSGMKLYKGIGAGRHARVAQRRLRRALATFETSPAACSRQQASPGFIELWSLQSRMAHRLRTRDEG